MFDLAIFGATYALFHATHGVFDYLLQTGWMGDNKSKRWDALLVHCSVYTFGFALALWFLERFGDVSISSGQFFTVLGWIFLTHVFMDNRKFLMWYVHKLRG